MVSKDTYFPMFSLSSKTQWHALTQSQALETYNIEKDTAVYIKKEFDEKYNPAWLCIVGQNFSDYVVHETKHSPASARVR